MDLILLGATEVPPWAQWGVLGALVAGFIFGQVVPGYLYKQLKDEMKAKDEQIKKLTDIFEEKVLPAMLEYNQVVPEMLQWVRKQKRGPT